MEAFKLIANKSLGGMIKSRIKTAAQRRQDYWNILFNCVRNCYEHNDVSWINKGLEMAKAVGRFRATKAILQQVTPYKFDTKTQQFGGKQRAGMVEKLGDKYSTVLQALVEAQQEADVAPKKAKDWEYEKARTNFLKACANHNVDLADVVVDIRDYVKKAA